MFELEGIRHRYGARQVLALEQLELRRGERVALVGANGSGKSTLLRIIACLEVPTEGTVRLDDRPLSARRDREAARRRVTLVEQSPFLFRGTVIENVAYPVRARGARPDDSKLLECLAMFGAEALASRDAGSLSGGEVQRVALARAIAAGPDALLLDEPTSAADRETREALTGVITALASERGVLVCVATHQLEEACRWSDRIVALHDGSLSPVVPENVFRVQLPGGPGMQRVNVGPLVFEVMSDRAGPAVLLIPPEEIVLSAVPLRSSARNSVTGRIVRISEQAGAMRVTLDAGIELVALITRASWESLGLRVGGDVVASFKSVAVRVV